MTVSIERQTVREVVASGRPEVSAEEVRALLHDLETRLGMKVQPIEGIVYPTSITTAVVRVYFKEREGGLQGGLPPFEDMTFPIAAQNYGV